MSQPHDSDRRATFLPPLWFWLLGVIAAGVVAWMWLPEPVDPAMSGIVTLIAGFTLLMALLLWFAFGSRYPKALRFAPLVLLVVAAAAGTATLRIKDIRGNVFPIFALRPWAADLLGVEQDRPPLDVPDEEQLAGANLNAAGDDPAKSKWTNFPRFLGPGGDNHVKTINLARDWAKDEPELIWKQDIGEGWSGFVVYQGFAYTMEQRGEEELVSCYGALDGKLRWVHSTPTRYDHFMGRLGPRSTPTVHEYERDGETFIRVYAQGANGHFHALDAATGEEVWSVEVRELLSITREQDMSNIPFGRAASPLIVDETVVVAGGGPGEGKYVSLIAFDKHTGDERWRAGDRQIAYASPVLGRIAGVRQILMVNQNWLSSYSTDGETLWEVEWPGWSNSDASCSQPVVLDDGRVFVSKAYSVGAKLFQVSKEDDGWKVKELWPADRGGRAVMKTKFSNVVIQDGYVYGLSEGILECVDLKTGKRVWKGGRYGYGQTLGVADLLLVISEDGELALIELTPERHDELAKMQAIEGKTWNTPCLWGPHVLVRNSTEAACYKTPTP